MRLISGRTCRGLKMVPAERSFVARIETETDADLGSHHCDTGCVSVSKPPFRHRPFPPPAAQPLIGGRASRAPLVCHPQGLHDSAL